MMSAVVRAGRWPARWTNAALLVLGAVSMLLYCKGAHDQHLRRITTFTAGALGVAIPYFLASWVIWRAQPARSTLWLVLGFALMFRIVGLRTEAYLSTDLYRYIWDGRVQAAHIDPYRYVPVDEHLAFLRDHEGPGEVHLDDEGRIMHWNWAIYPNINRKTYAKTVYPPVAQAIFLAVTRLSESVVCMRLTMVAAEALAVWGLARLLASFGLPAQRTLLYAWHPLAVWEFACAGHVDAIMIAFVVWALVWSRRERPVATGLTLACATLTKLFPVILAPVLYRRWRAGSSFWDWRMPVAFGALVLVSYLPYVLNLGLPGALGFLPMYTSEEGLQSGDRFFLLNLLPAQALASVGLSAYGVFVGLVLLAFALAAAWALWRPPTDELSFLRRCLCLATIFVAVLSSGYDWYYSWLIPYLCFLPYPWLFWLTAASMVLYLNWVHTTPPEIFQMNAAIYFPAAFLALLAFGWSRWRGARPVNPSPLLENQTCQ